MGKYKIITITKSKVSAGPSQDWPADQDTFTPPVNLKPFPGGSSAGACKSLQEVFVEILTDDIPAYLSAGWSYWFLSPPPAGAQVQRDCGNYLAGILMRIIERHLYFALLPSPFSSSSSHSYFRPPATQYLEDEELIPLDSVVNL